MTRIDASRGGNPTVDTRKPAQALHAVSALVHASCCPARMHRHARVPSLRGRSSNRKEAPLLSRSHFRPRLRKSSRWIAIFAACAVLVALLLVFAGSLTSIRGSLSQHDHVDRHARSFEPHSATWRCMEPGSCVDSQRYGSQKFSYGPSRGYFPQGCRWREVVFEDEGATSAYEYWAPQSKQWVVQRPPSCVLEVRLLAHRGLPVSAAHCMVSAALCMAHSVPLSQCMYTATLLLQCNAWRRVAFISSGQYRAGGGGAGRLRLEQVQ